eukprot:9250006-Pyramimonas_sp.AAC.1
MLSRAVSVRRQREKGAVDGPFPDRVWERWCEQGAIARVGNHGSGPDKVLAVLLYATGEDWSRAEPTTKLQQPTTLIEGVKHGVGGDNLTNGAPRFKEYAPRSKSPQSTLLEHSPSFSLFRQEGK